MFSIPKTKIKDFSILGNEDSFYNYINDNEFPIRRYIEKKYATPACFLYLDDEFKGDIFDFLVKNGSLLSFTSVGKVDGIMKDAFGGIRGGTFWFSYKDVYIRISLKDQPDEHEHRFINASVAHPPMNLELLNEEENEVENGYKSNKIFNMSIISHSKVQKYPVKDFEKFVIEQTKGKVHIFIKNQYNEYDFEPIKIEADENMDLALNYGEKFVEINDTIVKRLHEKPSGLYMFHGSPGTGKTTYIKYLAKKVDRDFIYVPTNMLEYFTTDPNSLSILLRKPNSILVLEDAEKAIMKREDGGTTSSVSSLLNLSDGIMSDIMKTSIILTYNCSKQDIDEALRRKGRLQMDYEFNLLSIDDSKNLAKSLGYPEDFIDEEIKADMSLADIYNLKTKVDFQEKKEDKSDRIIGFGS